jgi:hypothetical protein
VSVLSGDAEAWSIELDGRLVVEAPVDAAFALFSPVGEKAWVPGWEPEILHPPGSTWEPGLVFRTRDGEREVVWLVSSLDRLKHEVEYHRVEAGQHVARVRVACAARSPRQTEVRVRYLFVGLSDAGNRQIALMTAEAHGERMREWQRLIREHLERQDGRTPEPR